MENRYLKTQSPRLLLVLSTDPEPEPEPPIPAAGNPRKIRREFRHEMRDRRFRLIRRAFLQDARREISECVA